MSAPESTMPTVCTGPDGINEVACRAAMNVDTRCPHGYQK